MSRYKQQLEHERRATEELTVRLREEQRKQLSTTHTEEQHKALLEQVQQMNLLRESNVMLRDENEKNVRKAAQWEQKAKDLEATIAPLQETKLRIAAQVEVLATEKSSLETEVTHWKAKVQKLLVRT